MAAATLVLLGLQALAQDSTKAAPRLTIGGYGEAVATRNFYSLPKPDRDAIVKFIESI